MKTDKKMMNMTRILAQESMMKDVKKKKKNLPMLEFKVLYTWGNIIRVFEPFISFLSIT